MDDIGVHIGQILIESVSIAFDECVRMTKMMADSIAKIFYGQRSLDDFGSVVHMASVVGELSQSGNFALIIMFILITKYYFKIKKLKILYSII